MVPRAAISFINHNDQFVGIELERYLYRTGEFEICQAWTYKSASLRTSSLEIKNSHHHFKVKTQFSLLRLHGIYPIPFVGMKRLLKRMEFLKELDKQIRPKINSLTERQLIFVSIFYFVGFRNFEIQFLIVMHNLGEIQSGKIEL